MSSRITTRIRTIAGLIITIPEMRLHLLCTHNISVPTAAFGPVKIVKEAPRASHSRSAIYCKTGKMQNCAAQCPNPVLTDSTRTPSAPRVDHSAHARLQFGSRHVLLLCSTPMFFSVHVASSALGKPAPPTPAVSPTPTYDNWSGSGSHLG